MADRSLHLVVLILLGTALCGEWMWDDQWGPPACRAVSEVAPPSNGTIPQAHVNRRLWKPKNSPNFRDLGVVFCFGSAKQLAGSYSPTRDRTPALGSESPNHLTARGYS